MTKSKITDLHDDIITERDWTKKVERNDGFRDSGDIATKLEGGEYKISFKDTPQFHTPEVLNLTYRENEYLAHNVRYREKIDFQKLQKQRVWKAVPPEKSLSRARAASVGSAESASVGSGTPKSFTYKSFSKNKGITVRNAVGGHLTPPASAKEVETWSPIELGTHPDVFDLGEFVKKHFLPKPFESIQVDALENFPDFLDSIESIVCEDLIANLNQIRRTIDDAIRGPLRLLNKIEDKYFQILRDIDNLESSLIDLIKSLEGPNLNIGNLFNAYKNLAESCLFYNNLGQLDGILKAFEDIKNLADMTTPEFKDQLIDELVSQLKEKLLGTGNKSMGKILDDLIKDNVGSISQLKEMYRDMLAGAGVFDLLDHLAWLESCIRESCAAYKGLKGALEDTSKRYRDELGIPDDPNEPFDPLGKRWNNIKNRFGENWVDVEQKYGKLVSHTTELEEGIVRLKDNPDFFTIDGVSEFFMEAMA